MAFLRSSPNCLRVLPGQRRHIGHAGQLADAIVLGCAVRTGQENCTSLTVAVSTQPVTRTRPYGAHASSLGEVREPRAFPRRALGHNSSASRKGAVESSSAPSAVMTTCCSSLTPSLPPRSPMCSRRRRPRSQRRPRHTRGRRNRRAPARRGILIDESRAVDDHRIAPLEVLRRRLPRLLRELAERDSRSEQLDVVHDFVLGDVVELSLL